MRYQDRLLGLLPVKVHHVAQYIAREMETLALYSDSERVVQALDTLAQSPDPGVAVQALQALHRVYPRHLRRYYSPPGHAEGSRMATRDECLQSSGGTGQEDSMTPLDDSAPSNLDALGRSATHLLDPLVHAAGEVSRRATSEGARSRALRALIFIPHGASVEAAEDILASGVNELGPLALHAAAVHRSSSQESNLLGLIQHFEDTPAHGPALRALALAPSEGTLEYLDRFIQARRPSLLPSLAIALEGFTLDDALPRLAELSRHGTGWTQLQVLQTLSRFGHERVLPLIESIYWRHDHPTLRLGAIRAVASLSSSGARLFLRKVLEDKPAPQIAALALQSLQAVGEKAEMQARLGSTWLSSEDPEAATSAFLACYTADNRRALDALRVRLRSSNALDRQQAAYCLGYAQGRTSLEILSFLAQCDPSPPVRWQALTSFGYYQTTPLVRGHLLEMLPALSEELLPEAARLLTRPELAADGDVARALLGCLPRLEDPVLRGAFVPSLGRLEHLDSFTVVDEMLHSETEPAVLRGLLEAVRVRDRPPPGDTLEKLACEAGPRLRARALEISWLHGNDEAVRGLTGMLEDLSDEDGLLAALDSLQDMAVAGVHLAELPRFSSLRKTLKANLHSRAYREFAAGEYSLAIPGSLLMPGYDPEAPILARAGWTETERPDLVEAAEAGSGRGARPTRHMFRRATRPATLYRPTMVGEGLEGQMAVLSPQRLLTLGMAAAGLLMIAFGPITGALAPPGLKSPIPRPSLDRPREPARREPGGAPFLLQVASSSPGARFRGAAAEGGEPSTEKPLRPGQWIRAGSSLTCGERPMRLLMRGGAGLLRLESGAGITLAGGKASPGDPRFEAVLEDLQGEVGLKVSRKNVRVTLRLEAARIVTTPGRFRIKRDDVTGTVQVHVIDGSLELTATDGASRTLKAGETFEL